MCMIKAIIHSTCGIACHVKPFVKSVNTSLFI